MRSRSVTSSTMQYLTTTNAKTLKGEASGYLTGILYLAPGKQAGINVCPHASPGCLAACLFTAGRGRFDSVRDARVRRTLAFREDSMRFVDTLIEDIRLLEKRAAKRGLVPVVRLNGTSDLPWESLGMTSIMRFFPHLQFYDYTKSLRRMQRFLSGDWPANYHLTFSRSECNDEDTEAVLQAGGNVAVVFDTSSSPLPDSWCGYTVVDGDANDLRFLDPANVIVGLKAKGDARRDTSGFAVRVTERYPVEAVP